MFFLSFHRFTEIFLSIHLEFCFNLTWCVLCRICHCEGDEDCPLITPCRCTGSLSFVHQACLNQWIKSSDTRCCELCKFDFIMETKLKPLSKVCETRPTLCTSKPSVPSGPDSVHPSVFQWEKLHMSKNERRKIFCSVLFHLIAIVCMLWSVYILVKRTTDEIRLGKNGQYVPTSVPHTAETGRAKYATPQWYPGLIPFRLNQKTTPYLVCLLASGSIMFQWTSAFYPFSALPTIWIRNKLPEPLPTTDLWPIIQPKIKRLINPRHEPLHWHL